jgi:hypothetical protein
VNVPSAAPHIPVADRIDATGCRPERDEALNLVFPNFNTTISFERRKKSDVMENLENRLHGFVCRSAGACNNLGGWGLFHESPRSR